MRIFPGEVFFAHARTALFCAALKKTEIGSSDYSTLFFLIRSVRGRLWALFLLTMVEGVLMLAFTHGSPLSLVLSFPVSRCL